jgi:DNA-binding NtrC family response regulator
MHRHSEPATILIVEDDATLGQVLSRVLTCERQTALHVSSADEALRLVEERWPRLVLVDTGLREGRALALASAIRALSPSLPLILLSTDPIGRLDVSAGVVHLMTKSINLPDLRKAIDKVLAEARTKSQSDLVQTTRVSDIAGSRRLATTVNC